MATGPGEPPSPQSPGNRSPQRPFLRAAAARAFIPLLWNQLHDRVSGLFIYDKAAREANSIFVIHPADRPSDEEDAQTRKVAIAEVAWLRSATKPAVSRYRPLDGGVNLVCVPLGDLNRRLLVAIVPASEIGRRFLPTGMRYATTGATLVDDAMVAIVSTDPSADGKNLAKAEDPAVRSLADGFLADPAQRTLQIETPFTLRSGVTKSPRLLTVQPVDVAGSKWCLFVGSPLADINAVVNDVFRRALIWAAFVVVSVTGILVSTAVQLIRSQSRVERLRHDLLTRELTQARDIQLKWLPEPFSPRRDLDAAACNKPASHISGDFYNWFDLPDGRTVFIIGDVTGHGMAAAFLMATTQLLVRNTMTRLLDPGKCLREVNRQLCVQMFNGQFVTMLIVVVDARGGWIEVATAGHPAPLLGEGGEFARLPLEPQLVMGVQSDEVYPTERFKLPSRASLLMYTDGVVDIEGQARAGGRFGIQRLLTCAARGGESAQSILASILDAAEEFRGGSELGDDVTLVALQICSSAEEAGGGQTADAAEVANQAVARTMNAAL